jgi:hypothetical protein
MEQGNRGAVKAREPAYLKPEYLQFTGALDSLLLLPAELRELIVTMINAAARRGRK